MRLGRVEFVRDKALRRGILAFGPLRGWLWAFGLLKMGAKVREAAQTRFSDMVTAPPFGAPSHRGYAWRNM